MTDEEAQRSRAERLRAEIERIKGTETSEARRPAPRVKRPLSPREFIHQRMRELQEDESKKPEEGQTN